MVMGRRPDVKTASAPIAAVDAIAMGGQLGAALLRVPFRNPFRGQSTMVSNLGSSVTREVLRSFMGYTSSLPIEEFRSIEQLLDDVCRMIMPPIVERFGVRGEHTEFGGVPGMLYQPAERTPDGLILYLHGGGYIGTSPSMYAFFTARLCAETKCAIFVADYRLAPEFPFPAGVEDADAIMCEFADRGVTRERMIVAGDSGGGGLATQLMLYSRMRSIAPAALLLFSPEVDLLLDEPSVTENASRDILPWNIPTAAYLHGLDPKNADVDPFDADLSKFPPTFVAWGADEMFRDPIRRFVVQLDAAGVEYHAHEAEGMFHVFPILMPWSASSHRVYREAAAFVHDVLAGAPPMEKWPI
jgi:epsilon-lactone hydrolase